jgi:hypothetical protein
VPKQSEVQLPEIIEMKPLPPVKPTEKLPLTHHLTIVTSPDRSDRFRSVIGTEMQGDRVVRRRVLYSGESLNEVLDELNRLAVRFFYFNEGREHMETA